MHDIQDVPDLQILQKIQPRSCHNSRQSLKPTFQHRIHKLVFWDVCPNIVNVYVDISILEIKHVNEHQNERDGVENVDMLRDNRGDAKLLDTGIATKYYWDVPTDTSSSSLPMSTAMSVMFSKTCSG
jgi:hypothetical protein